MSVLLLIIGLLLFIGLVVAHEWGHFIMARRNGVEVEEFGIFFPPRLFKHKTKSGWLFTINLLPLGGFVKLKGEHDTDTAKGSFGAATVWAKAQIMAAGVLVNLIIALVLLTVVAVLGMPKLVDNQFTVASDTHQIRHATSSVEVDEVAQGSPSQKAGLKLNDLITGLGPTGQVQKITSVSELQSATKRYAGQEVQVRYTRDNESKVASTTLNTAATVAAAQKTNHPVGYLGVTLDEVKSGFDVRRSTWSAPIVAVGTSYQFTVLTFQGLGHALGGLGSLIAGGVTGDTVARQHGQTSASSQVGGPVAIFFVLKEGSVQGVSFMLFIIGIVSLTLAIMNILPIPALDGGRLWLTLITRALKRPLSPRREEIINATGFLVLITLIVLITIVDFQRFL